MCNPVDIGIELPLLKPVKFANLAKAQFPHPLGKPDAFLHAGHRKIAMPENNREIPLCLQCLAGKTSQVFHIPDTMHVTVINTCITPELSHHGTSLPRKGNRITKALPRMITVIPQGPPDYKCKKYR